VARRRNRTTHRQSLLLAARELAERGSTLVREPEIAEQPFPIAGLCVERGVQVERFRDAHLVRQLALLELDAADAPELVAVMPRVEAEHADRA
jgi:hypothetical protein